MSAICFFRLFFVASFSLFFIFRVLTQWDYVRASSSRVNGHQIFMLYQNGLMNHRTVHDDFVAHHYLPPIFWGQSTLRDAHALCSLFDVHVWCAWSWQKGGFIFAVVCCCRLDYLLIVNNAAINYFFSSVDVLCLCLLFIGTLVTVCWMFIRCNGS